MGKNLRRRGKALAMLKEYEAAARDLAIAAKLEPEEWAKDPVSAAGCLSVDDESRSTSAAEAATATSSKGNMQRQCGCWTSLLRKPDLFLQLLLQRHHSVRAITALSVPEPASFALLMHCSRGACC